jgi:hypothetical protein
MEKDLLERIAAGDEGAFGDIFYKYKDRLYGFIFGQNSISNNSFGLFVINSLSKIIVAF